MTETLHHYINGKTAAGTSTRTSPVYNPATGEVTKNLALASVADVDTAVAAASAAYPEWRDLSQAKRQAIMFRFRELINERRDELAAIITSEHGKVLSDAGGEVARGIEVVEFAPGMPHLMKGDFGENVSTGVDVYSIKQPLGPVAIISPFNFPAMVPMWFFPIALATGNTVVLKPSEKDPSAANWMAELDRKSTRLNSSHVRISYAVFCLKKKKKKINSMKNYKRISIILTSNLLSRKTGIVH